MTEIQEQNFVLKIFQFRAARMVTGITLETIGQYLGFTAAAVSLWECKDNLAQLKTSQKNILIIKKIFAEHNILFPDENTIALNDSMNEYKPESLTRFQLRAARTALNISQRQLAKFLNISPGIIMQAELLKNNEYIRLRKKTLSSILRTWFQNKDIAFDDDLIISFGKDKKMS